MDQGNSNLVLKTAEREGKSEREREVKNKSRIKGESEVFSDY